MRKKQQVKQKTLFNQIAIQFMRNKMAIIGLIILTLIISLGLLSFFATETSIGVKVFEGTYFDYEKVISQNLNNPLLTPSKDHFLGTDEYGRDILARMIYGIRISFTIGITATLIAVVVGIFFGSISGYYGGTLDQVIMRFMDIWLAIRSILLAIIFVSSFGNSTLNLLIAISISSIPAYARIIRSSIITVKDNEYIEAAHAIGAKDSYIILRHIIPNCLSPIIVQSTLGVAGAILSISGLSFLGIGIQPPTPEWGNMLANGKQFMLQAPHVVLFPGMMIVITILSLNLLGDGLRDALDPKLKR
ncbi:MAG: ABC transporter permease [Spiroplasma sp.]|nr:ABC transporter permease [Mycoplasmatales bacterium]